MVSNEVRLNIDHGQCSFGKHNAQTGMLAKYFKGNSVLNAQIDDAPPQDLSLVVVIPAMNEPNLIQSLIELKNCQQAEGSIEVIVVINHSEGASNEIVNINECSQIQSKEWAANHSTGALKFHVLYHPDLSAKKGGVGMARKIGMDEAARRLLSVGNREGVIACFDADCECDPNYLKTIIGFFKTHTTYEGVSIHFEHQLGQLDQATRKAIVHYELHLRYFIDAQRWARYPFAYQTVGSSMAVRADSYIKVGGMNMRKAGEDFYFLHKIIERGAHSDLTSTTVFPSARSSDRVPFGTGKAVADLLEGASSTTYNPCSFEDLRVFIASVPEFYSAQSPEHVIGKLPQSIREFLLNQNFNLILEEIKGNTASPESFEKRFFRWFNAFRLMKYVHFARDHFYPDVQIREAVDWLYTKLDITVDGNIESLLIKLRERDKDLPG